MEFSKMLKIASTENHSFLCVGLDPDPLKFPPSVLKFKRPIFEFCKTIVEATHDLVCAFKPQIAYFSSIGAEKDLEDLIVFIHQSFPNIPVILDAKRGDIGSTAKQYAKEAFQRYRADCVTVSPYMGIDTIEPYLEYEDKGIFVLCRTSNAGGADFELLECQGTPLYLRVAEKLETLNKPNQIGLVVGATYPQELAKVREVSPRATFLVPGIGAQGGDIFLAASAGKNASGKGMIFNSSRAVIYASKDAGYAQKAREVAQKTRDKINQAVA